MIFKLVSREAWDAACRDGAFRGSSDDLRDGFIHFSDARQVRETAARHFKGAENIVLVAFNAADLGEALVWEPSRGGELFPHLYGPLPTALALWVTPLATGADGAPEIPAELVSC